MIIFNKFSKIKIEKTWHIDDNTYTSDIVIYKHF